jgi:hypothetical protein
MDSRRSAGQAREGIREAAAEFIARALREEGSRLTDEIVASVRAEVDGLADLSPEAMAELVTAHLDRAIAAISERRQPTQRELTIAATTAVELARSGLAIETVLRARRVAIRRSCELLRVAAAAAELDPETQVECIYRMWEWAEAIQVADAEAHRTAELELNQTGDTERAWFVRALLQGTLSPSEVSGRAPAYGLLPGSTYRAFRARPAGSAGPAKLSRALEATGADDPSDVLLVNIGGDLCGVLRNRPQLAGEGVVGLGSETDLVRLDTSFALATRALEAAVAFDYEGVVTIEDLSLRPAVLAEEDLGERLVGRYLEPLAELGDFGITLETTVREYLAHGMRIEESAKALFVHPNTLRHRLDRFQQLTGADVRNTEDVIGMWWALQRRFLNGRGFGASS